MVRAVAPPAMQDQEHEQDYSKNKRYQQGMREGKDDQAHNRDHSKKRHFKKDDSYVNRYPDVMQLTRALSNKY